MFCAEAGGRAFLLLLRHSLGIGLRRSARFSTREKRIPAVGLSMIGFTLLLSLGAECSAVLLLRTEMRSYFCSFLMPLPLARLSFLTFALAL